MPARSARCTASWSPCLSSVCHVLDVPFVSTRFVALASSPAELPALTFVAVNTLFSLKKDTLVLFDEVVMSFYNYFSAYFA